MSTGSGLDAQIGFGVESTWGTGVTPTRFMEFLDESLAQEITYLDSAGIHAGTTVKRTKRTTQARFDVAGDVNMEVATSGMGLILKHCLGSSVTAPALVSGATSAYKQIHTPGGLFGLGLTAQVGRPEPGTGTVQPFTYSGCKVSKWTLDIKDNAIPTFGLTLSGRQESTATALTTAAYLAGSGVFSFANATVKLGGTVATASGETTITGGTAIAAVVKGVSVSGDNALATDRFGLGNAGYKREPLQNGMQTFMGKFDAEFAQEELYDVYTAGEPIPVQIDLTGDEIETGHNFLLSVIMPSVFFKKAAPVVSGVDIVQMSTDYEAEWDETNPPIQFKIVSKESSAI